MSARMTPEEVEEWILAADFMVLERRVLSFDEVDQQDLLSWALKLHDDCEGTKAQIKWAVAIIGTLAPETFDHDDDKTLSAEYLDVMPSESDDDSILDAKFIDTD